MPRRKKTRGSTNTSPPDPLESTLHELRVTDPVRYARIEKALQSLGEARRRWEATDGVPMSQEESVRAALLNYENATLKCVGIDKRMLYLSPDVMWCIQYAQRWGRRDFFVRLSDAIKVGIGEDRRLMREPDWPARLAAILRGKRLTYPEIFNRLGRLALEGRMEPADKRLDTKARETVKKFLDRFADYKALQGFLKRRGLV